VIALPNNGELGAIAPVVVKFSVNWEKKRVTPLNIQYVFRTERKDDKTIGLNRCLRHRNATGLWRFDEAGSQRIGLLREDQALVKLATLHSIARFLHEIGHGSQIGPLLFSQMGFVE